MNYTYTLLTTAACLPLLAWGATWPDAKNQKPDFVFEATEVTPLPARGFQGSPFATADARVQEKRDAAEAERRRREAERNKKPEPKAQAKPKDKPATAQQLQAFRDMLDNTVKDTITTTKPNLNAAPSEAIT